MIQPAGLLLYGLVVLVVVLAAGRVFWRDRQAYFLGLWTSLICFFLETVWFVVNPATMRLPWWVSFIWLAPLLEESIRIAAMRRMRSSKPADWIFFGIGFGGFEAMLKLLQTSFAVSRNSALPDYLPVTVVIPFLLHVFLSVVAGGLLNRGWAPFAVLSITVALHVLNNWRAFEITQQTDVPFAATLLIGQGLIVGALCALVVWTSRRVTTAAPHANTPP